VKPPTRPPGLAAVLGDEGLRLFFPLAALHAALWPFLWAALLGFDLPLARSVPPALWHAHEMILGAFGGALIGFLTTAIPEWTDTARPRGRTLFVLAAIWGLARLIGLPGADALGMVAALADIAWLGWLIVFAIRVSLARRTEKLLAFIGWLAALLACEIAIRAAFLSGDIAMAQDALRIAGLVFLGLLGLALARITTPITNLVLDPSEETAPFRPHPGRLNLAPGLLVLLIAGEIAGLSPAVTGYLAIGAGAAFLDRVAEGFVGRAGLRAELLALAGASLLAGLGLLALGASRLGAPWPASAGLHLAFMGGLGLGVLAVFALAGLLHTGQPLGLDRSTRLALLLLPLAVLLRVAPDFGFPVPGPMHLLAALIWPAAFLIWLRRYWPLLSDPATIERKLC
jgi:uncharacterized protein involved in response to NO